MKRFFMNRPVLISAFTIALMALIYQNCGQPRYDMKDSVTDLTNSQNNPGPGSAGNAVCDPTTGNGTLTGGLVAELYYLNKNTAQTAATVMDFFDPRKGEKSTQQIFFTQINMPPQLFNQGFVTQNGQLVRDNAGNKLYEWFALKYFSELKVTRAQDEGYYEFASLSDDGHIMEAQINGQWKRIISDDGLHSPRIACSPSTILLKKDQPVSIRVYYFQGPADHISNMLHWRKTAAGNQVVGDQECGKSPNANYFYDPNTSTPLAPYKAFLSRGWQVVPSNVFVLPSTVVSPCVIK